MTKAELNTDVRRLYKRFKGNRHFNTALWSREDWDAYSKEDNEIKREFKRLYRADNSCEYLNFKSFRMMITMNLSLRVQPLHLFYNDIII